MTSTGARTVVAAGDWHRLTRCPMCGGELGHDEVDLGVGVAYGPEYCIDCGWCADSGDEMLLDESFDD